MGEGRGRGSPQRWDASRLSSCRPCPSDSSIFQIGPQVHLLGAGRASFGGVLSRVPAPSRLQPERGGWELE